MIPCLDSKTTRTARFASRGTESRFAALNAQVRTASRFFHFLLPGKCNQKQPCTTSGNRAATKHVCTQECKAGQPNGLAGPLGHLGPSPPTWRLAWRHRAPCTSASAPGTASAVTSTCACMYVCVCVCVCKPLPTHSGCCPATLPAPLGRLPLL